MRDTTFPRHVHVWREVGNVTDTTALVECYKCESNLRASATFLFPKVAREFRRQIKRGVKPRFVRDGLVPVDWSKRKASGSNA